MGVYANEPVSNHSQVLVAGRPARLRDYAYSFVLGLSAIAVRALLDPYLKNEHAFVLSLMTVVFASWKYGFWPGVLALLVSMTGMVYFFIEPRETFLFKSLSDQIAVGLCFICGIACAALGLSQRHFERMAARALSESNAQRNRLEDEVVRRRAIESALRNREAELRESEAQFRTLADNISQLAWMTDPSGRRQWFNRRWFDYTGTTLDQVRDWGWRIVQHPDHVDRVDAKFRECIQTGEPWEDTFPIQCKDGAFRWFLSRAVPVRNADGKIVRWFGTNTDVTEQREIEQIIRHSAERFRILTETIPQIVWNADASGSLEYVNAQWQTYTRMDLDAARGRGWLNAVHGDDVARIEAVWNMAIIQTADRFSQELRLLRSDGIYRWMLAIAIPLRRPDGTVDLWIGSMTDIHDQKQQEHTLEQMVRERTAELEELNTTLRAEIVERQRAEERAQSITVELQRSNRELEQFAYVASHDLQEPLRKIQAFGDRLGVRHRAELGEQGRDYVDRMCASAGRMSRLIDDLLAYSRVTTLARPFTRVNLNDVLTEAIDDLTVRIEQSGGTIEAGTLPVIDADPIQMRQLFQNLIVNALKFRNSALAPVVRIHANVTENANHPEVRIEFVDNGIGFDQKYAGRIFQVFQRLHGRGEYEGTGVGLAICKKIVERHSGSIDATSRPTEGATFTVTLPIRQHSSSIGSAEQQESEAVQSKPVES